LSWKENIKSKSKKELLSDLNYCINNLSMIEQDIFEITGENHQARGEIQNARRSLRKVKKLVEKVDNSKAIQKE